MRRVETPWGPSQHSRELASGITQHSTASHGGIHLDEERMERFRQTFPWFTTYAGGPWFEEDCDVTAVYLAFADEFEDVQVRGAVMGAECSAKYSRRSSDQWKRIVHWLDHTKAGKKAVDRVLAFEETVKDCYEVGSCSTTGKGWLVMMHPVSGGEKIQCRMTTDQMYSKRFFSREEVESMRVIGGAELVCHAQSSGL